MSQKRKSTKPKKSTRTPSQKNVVSNTEIEAGGDVQIGDKTTINVFGLPTDESFFRTVNYFFMGLVMFFSVGFVISLFVPPNKSEMTDYINTFLIASFAFLTIICILLLNHGKASISPQIIKS